MTAKDYTDEIDLQKYLLVLRRRWLPASLVFVSSVVLAGVYGITRPPVYLTSGTLIFATNATTSLTGVGENLGRLEPLFLSNNPLDTQAEILTSDTLIQQVIEDLKLQDEEGREISPYALKMNLSVKAIPGTDVLRISYETDDPELSAKVVNRLMETYIQYDIRTNRADAAAAREFIEQELPVAEIAVNEAAADLQQFKDRNRIISLEDESKSAVESLAVLETQISQLRAELASGQTRSRELMQQLEMDVATAVTSNTLSQVPGVQQALGSFQAIQAELSQARARYTDNHPIIENLKRQEAAAYDLLQTQVAQVVTQPLETEPGRLQLGTLQQQLVSQLVQTEVDRLALESRIGSLLESRDRYLDWSSTFPNLEKQQQQLVNRLRAAQTTYEGLLLRQQQIQLAENQTVGNARILDYASVPTDSVGTSSKLYVGAGGVGGFLMGIAIAVLLDLVDRSVKTVKEAEILFGWPVLGVIPKYRLTGLTPPLEGEVVAPLTIAHAGPYPMVSDAYQMLQANLKFVSSDKRLKTFVVTSSVPEEGKTSVAAQLAMTISQSGRKVLLIEADLRSPNQHHVWGVMNGIGLSHVLVGEGNLEESLQPISENLTLMTAGVQPPNPLALLDSEQMANVLGNLSQQYDMVIIDTPPLAGAADAAILGKMTDGVILVVRPRVADSASATAAKSLLSRSNATVLGLVANAVEMKIEHDDYSPYTTKAKGSSEPRFRLPIGKS
ncbi:MAG: polysaccharide biosynthesis tyrosine autokinase [Leptolyngbyaceae cyanobacterium T60_A2020_046]|nr:polysaccharide biosynthesis tyrosine autokinase [Leptolyngbyaceae cyanobacterium T60_A2020_046]